MINDKCELIRTTNAKFSILYDYSIIEKKMTVASSVTYPELYVDEYLTWKKHVKHTISKANSTSRVFLQRNIVYCPRAWSG